MSIPALLILGFVGCPLGLIALLYLVLRFPLALVLVDLCGCIAFLLLAWSDSSPRRLIWLAVAAWLALRAYRNWHDRHRHRRVLELLGYKARAARARLLASVPRPARGLRSLPDPA